MKNLIPLVFLYIISFLPARCQNLTGSWSGEVTQENSQFKIGTIEISLNQVGGFLSGQIKTNHPQGFVIQKFRGMISDHKVVMTEYEVIKKSEDNLSWCLKILEGYLFTDNDTGKLILRGKWTSRKVHQSGNYLEFDCPPGTFSVTKSSDESAPQKLASLTTSNLSRKVSEPKSPESIKDIAKVIDIQKPDNLLAFPKPKLGEKVILAIQFEQSKAIILPSSQPELDRILSYLVQFPTLEIELSGHTDNRGDAIKNYKLSEERVSIVKKYLTSNGIASSRISGKGYGSKIPFALNDSEENRKLNRRVEMKVTKE
ncbi:OmpA family protein [Dyadobacter sp. 3J3]|uniref:OmpA family protein n=1 Tax=Dyadobacter sp. 3J3 TaxID=2606600 RepID=UPI001E35255B|nr:OmpA family protein [Dyadobacter sp. 3J3]